MTEQQKPSPALYRERRIALRLTQSQLAEKLGVTSMTIHRREAGEAPITREAWIAIETLTNETK